MGTRADFYVGRGENAEWLGSIAWDGNPESIPNDIRFAVKEDDYRAAVAAELAGREDATKPEMGWPWSWENSRKTDFAYAFDGSDVWASCFGREWFDACNEPEDPAAGPRVAVFPDMSKRRAPAIAGPRSGMIVIGSKG